MTTQNLGGGKTSNGDINTNNGGDTTQMIQPTSGVATSNGTSPLTTQIQAMSLTTIEKEKDIEVSTAQVPVVEEHILLGSSGPDQREINGIQKALDWLKDKRLPDYSWANDTHMVILAKELSGARDPTDQDNHVQIIADLEDTLSVKQMEIEILSLLDKYV